ncbi:MAG: hypothetical protein WAO71_11095, partial [Gallionella sp.]
MRGLRFLNTLLFAKHPLQDRQYARTEHCNAFPTLEQKQRDNRKLSSLYKVISAIGCGLLMFLPCGQAVAAVQCSPAETSSFQAQCDAYGVYVAGLETDCLTNYGPGYWCGHYPLPSRVHPIPMGLGCEVILENAPVQGPGSVTGEAYTLDCSHCPKYSTANANDNMCTCDANFFANGSQTECTNNQNQVPKGAGAPSCSGNQVYRGNPVNVKNGVKSEVEVDYQSPTGLAFE